ncbi:hypothetical protein [Streptomyces sp. SAS_272]|uniref:hypothetical protein n=1 Tax=Streptomyces sp. SAS_272 TaxID=3412747 RepID=UPI00403C4682
MDEAEYRAHLQGERRAYAWVMRRYGGMSLVESWAAALRWYPSEPPDEPYRLLVFHDPSWHWAMSALHGDRYAEERPDLAAPPDAYYRA